ncbi:hypothetical protein [Legionella longbeachae]|uniref:Uncharacterized protein n=1 Tax=Legionella longbeachae serogroup 1 (strain NSW150) TaxID=661367 RepID=D3HR88_LEGLN|nr:hypothetical protein [Legionella longbeachae]VEE01926.1 Uncharacterised protein [Legionella oakridgensis]HBD7396823.1 hypothetical protein [Legionella pneumophila]ARB91759.1 hypothetical protein A6J40_05995 [Legionella longbeachae]QIN35163.1 hypothetical protein GCS73_05725 [Legionella longbeachae]RZV28094.1 hypothetical protein EKG34_00490 [Legionella longbeachae]
MLHFLINEIKENFNFECVSDNKKKEVLTWMLIWNQERKENPITTPPRPLARSISNKIADIDAGRMLMSLSEEQLGNIIRKTVDRFQRSTLIKKIFSKALSFSLQDLWGGRGRSYLQKYLNELKASPPYLLALTQTPAPTLEL